MFKGHSEAEFFVFTLQKYLSLEMSVRFSFSLVTESSDDHGGKPPQT